jgi:hypothetical protein
MSKTVTALQEEIKKNEAMIARVRKACDDMIGGLESTNELLRSKIKELNDLSSDSAPDAMALEPRAWIK